MPTITLTLGLPGSGKSTWAKQQANSNTVIVCKDDIRAMLCPDGKWSGKRERLTTDVQRATVSAALDRGKSVIIADTNLNKRVREHWQDYCKLHRGGVEYKEHSFLDVPVETCIERDLKRHDSVGKDVIMRMWLQYVAQPKPAWNESLPVAVIVDLDGTLANNYYLKDGRQNRGWYDWDRVEEDDVHYHVAAAVDGFRQGGLRIIALTGRDGAAYEGTKRWLVKHNIPFDLLYSRAEGDQRKDSVVKEELYREHIEGKFNVACVIDDRAQVVTKWRELGLEVMQVLHPQEFEGF